MTTYEMNLPYSLVVSQDAVKDIDRLLNDGNSRHVFSLHDGNGINRLRSILELEGLGKEIWQGIDPKKYINELRDDWDNR